MARLLLLAVCVKAHELTALLTEARELVGRLESYPEAAAVRHSLQHLRRELRENSSLGVEQVGHETQEEMDA